MAVYRRDPQRLQEAIGRLRASIKLLPWVLVPLCAAICGTPMVSFGQHEVVFGLVCGVFVGLFAAAVCASTIEWMILMLIYLDNNGDDIRERS